MTFLGMTSTIRIGRDVKYVNSGCNINHTSHNKGGVIMALEKCVRCGVVNIEERPFVIVSGRSISNKRKAEENGSKCPKCGSKTTMLVRI